jgi:hypothetical protein
LGEHGKIYDSLIEALDEAHWPRRWSRYSFVSPFDTLRRTVFHAIKSGLSEEEAARLAAAKVISDVERDTRREHIPGDALRRLEEAARQVARHLYQFATRQGNSYAKLVKYTNDVRDYIYVARLLRAKERAGEEKQ